MPLGGGRSSCFRQLDFPRDPRPFPSLQCHRTWHCRACQGRACRSHPLQWFQKESPTCYCIRKTSSKPGFEGAMLARAKSSWSRWQGKASRASHSHSAMVQPLGASRQRQHHSRITHKPRTTHKQAVYRGREGLDRFDDSLRADDIIHCTNTRAPESANFLSGITRGAVKARRT